VTSRKTGKQSGVIHKYGLNLGRQEFREKAKDIGFVKVSSGSPKGPRSKHSSDRFYSIVDHGGLMMAKTV